jgi:hypothetical protein
MKLTEFYSNCINPELEKQFIKTNCKESKDKPLSNLKILFENNPSDNLLMTA